MTSGEDEEVQFDTLGRLERTWHFVPGPVSTPKRVVEELVYDVLGRVVGRSLPAWDSTTPLSYVSFGYDGWNRVTSRTAGDGTSSIYTYTGSTTNARVGNKVSHFTRDGAGRLITSIDANNNVVRTGSLDLSFIEAQTELTCRRDLRPQL